MSLAKSFAAALALAASAVTALPAQAGSSPEFDWCCINGPELNGTKPTGLNTVVQSGVKLNDAGFSPANGLALPGKIEGTTTRQPLDGDTTIGITLPVAN